MEENKKIAFPKIPESNWWSIRKQFKKTIPSVVNITYLKSLLDLESDISARNLMAPLKSLGLINEEGKPTSRANEWRDDDKYTKVCNDMILENYPQELLDLYPDNTNLDKKNISKWFMTKCAIGEGTANIVASTFILLKEATIKDDEPIKKQSKGKMVKEGKKDMGIANKITPVSGGDVIPAEKNGPSMHIDLQIHISPDATANQIDCIFASISKHLYK